MVYLMMPSLSQTMQFRMRAWILHCTEWGRKWSWTYLFRNLCRQ